MRRKHVPRRTCVGCRQVRPKHELVRLVRTPAMGVQVDETGKQSGRGAYLCSNRECWSVALRTRSLDRALKTSLSSEERLSLERYGQALATDERLSAKSDALIQNGWESERQR